MPMIILNQPLFDTKCRYFSEGNDHCWFGQKCKYKHVIYHTKSQPKIIGRIEAVEQQLKTLLFLVSTLLPTTVTEPQQQPEFISAQVPANKPPTTRANTAISASKIARPAHKPQTARAKSATIKSAANSPPILTPKKTSFDPQQREIASKMSKATATREVASTISQPTATQPKDASKINKAATAISIDALNTAQSRTATIEEAPRLTPAAPTQIARSKSTKLTAKDKNKKEKQKKKNKKKMKPNKNNKKKNKKQKKKSMLWGSFNANKPRDNQDINVKKISKKKEINISKSSKTTQLSPSTITSFHQLCPSHPSFHQFCIQEDIKAISNESITLTQDDNLEEKSGYQTPPIEYFNYLPCHYEMDFLSSINWENYRISRIGKNSKISERDYGLWTYNTLRKHGYICADFEEKAEKQIQLIDNYYGNLLECDEIALRHVLMDIMSHARPLNISWKSIRIKYNLELDNYLKVNKLGKYDDYL